MNAQGTKCAIQSSQKAQLPRIQGIRQGMAQIYRSTHTRKQECRRDNEKSLQMLRRRHRTATMRQVPPMVLLLAGDTPETSSEVRAGESGGARTIPKTLAHFCGLACISPRLPPPSPNEKKWTLKLSFHYCSLCLDCVSAES